MKVAVLVSGTGTILESMVSHSLPIDLVLADRACRGLEIARLAKIPSVLLARTDFSKTFDRTTYTKQVTEELKRRGINLIAMAGFMTVLNEPIFKHYAGRILNIHPSLLPAFKGAHAVRDALAAGVSETGTTIHIATMDLDAGPIVAQEKVLVSERDTEEILHERIKEVERELYPATVRRIISGELVLPQVVLTK